MKQINTYINEKLHITTKSYVHHYTCHPKTRKELSSIIMERIESEGVECDLNDIDVSNIEDMTSLFEPNSFLSTETVLFDKFKDFNGDISKWDVSNVKNMAHMFSGCKKFNGDISKWNVSNVYNMDCMFAGCESFNCDLSDWDVSHVNGMISMFCECKNFNSDISKWDVSNVTEMDNMFDGCEKFNCDISDWDMSHVESILEMFNACKNFRQNLNGWNIRIKEKRLAANAFNLCPTQPRWYISLMYK